LEPSFAAGKRSAASVTWDWVRNWPGVNPVFFLKITLRYSVCSKPTFSATIANEKSVCASNCLARFLVLGGTAQRPGESPLQRAARQRHGPQHVADINPFGGVLADVTHGGGDVAVLYREDFRGTPCDNPRRFDEDGLLRRPRPRHHSIEQGGGFVADPFGVGHHARQGWIGQVAQHLVVVHANHGDFVRHRHTNGAARIEDLLATNIVAGHQANGLGQTFQPAGDKVFVF
jgi:hypothetical protein